MLSAQHPGFHSIQKSADDNCHVTLTLVIKRSGWLCHILCWRWPKELLALARRWSRSLVIMASLEITLLRYVSRWPLMVIWGGLYTASGEFWWSETSVFFRLMVRPNAWAALAKWSTIVWRVSFVCAVQGSAPRSSLFRARRRRRLRTLPSVRNPMWMPSLSSSLTSLSIVLRICFPYWQFLLFLSGLELFLELNFPRHQPVGFEHLYPSFPRYRPVVCVAVSTGHDSGL